MSPSFSSSLSYALLPLALLAGCHSAKDDLPGDPGDHHPWQGISLEETVRFTGTEPFWGGRIEGSQMIWSTPEDPGGTVVEVRRFAGRGGLSFSGQLADKALTLTVTPADCSDGMSDYRYPFAVSVRLGDELRQGCGWTERQPRSEPR